ncbi:MAG TPA: hypothetical protein VH853_05820 [Polyangia bacterium]|jgi:hypothetical protein|nr:hypothetical protein [Polyangia bacterium]
MTTGGSPGIAAWIWFLRALTVFNVAVWLRTAVALQRDRALQGPERRDYRRRQLILSALFVGGCAFRSIFPRADVQRICLYDNWLSVVLIGRAVATIAELAFMTQWAFLLGESAGPGPRDVAKIVSRVLVPIIAVAEICSWYAVLSTNYLGNALEQSIWTFASALVVVALLSGERGAGQLFVGIATALIGAYIVFMSTVDVPMYIRRWRADEQTKRPYLTFIEGMRDAGFHRVVTRDWDPWREEVPWMSLYFSTGVWVSLWLIRAAPARRACVTLSDENVTQSSLSKARG